MARRYEIDDAQWERIKPYLGNTQKKTGRPQSDNRKLLNGVLWILHTGAPWRDLPAHYGPWQTVYKRFSQWQKDDKLNSFLRMFAKIQICRICALTVLISKRIGQVPVQKKGLQGMMIISILESAEEEDPQKSMQ